MPDEKMKYPLLEFEYDKKLYEELLTLNHIRSLWIGSAS